MGFQSWSFLRAIGVVLLSASGQIADEVFLHRGNGDHASDFHWDPKGNCHLDEANGYDFPEVGFILMSHTQSVQFQI